MNTNQIQAIIDDCTYLEPLSDAYHQNEIIQSFGTPNKPIYVSDKIEFDDRVFENALVLALDNAIAILTQNSIASYKPADDGMALDANLIYAYMGEKPKPDDEIYIAYTIEQFFTLVKCEYRAVLVLFSKPQKAFEPLTDTQFKRINQAVERLQKDGYYNLYLPLSIYDASKMIDGVQVLPLTVQNGHGQSFHIDLSRDDDIGEIKTLLELAKQQRKPPYLTPSFAWDKGWFKVKQDGVYFVETNKDGEQFWQFISSPIIVKASTRDNTGNDWGRLLEWTDPDGRTHRKALPMELFQSDGLALREILANAGVMITPTTKARNLFACYLMKAPTPHKALCVERVGWHDTRYILPHKVYGQSNELIVYQGSNSVSHAYQSRGALSDWQTHVAKPCEHHTKLVFAICTAFAGALLEPMNLKGQGFHYKGTSSKGKTTILNLACSVWGNPNDFMRTWRATGNALEYTAFLHNDGFLALDEIGQINRAKELGEIAYMLCNGQGKARMTKNLANRPLKTWRLIVLSSGEQSLKEVMAEAGQTTKLGQEIRLIDIDVDNGLHGIFDSVNFKETASQQAEYLNQQSKQYYGIAGEAWLAYLCDNYHDVLTHAHELYKQYKQELEKGIDDGHIKRVAGQFALIATAGELAKDITQWQIGHALNAVRMVFNDWHSQFEYKDNYLQMQILQQVRAFIETHGSSRFENADSFMGERVNNRAGYYKDDKGERSYFIFPSVFRNEVCKGLNQKLVTQILIEHEWLITAGSRTTKQQRVHDQNNPIWLYTLSPKVLTDDL